MASATLDQPAESAAELVAELTSQPAPEGVDPNVWKELLATFCALDLQRAAAAAPSNEANRIASLALASAGPVEDVLTWVYRNVGDYDLNGVVNISDLTPLGVHFGKVLGDPDWNTARVADGDENGSVDMADITPIGRNYSNQVDGYLVETTATPDEDGSWLSLGTIDLDAAARAEGEAYPRFNYELGEVTYGNYYRVTPYYRQPGTGDLLPGINGQAVLLATDLRGQWWMECSDNRHSSYCELPGPLTNHIWWSLDIGGEGGSGPVYDLQGRIYIGGEKGLYLIEPDGSSLQVFLTPEPVATTPALDRAGTAYFGSNDGKLYALGADGVLRWAFATGGPVSASPAVADDGTIWFASEDKNLYGLNPDGTEINRYSIDKNFTYSPTVASDGIVYAGFRGAYPGYGQEVMIIKPGEEPVSADFGLYMPAIAIVPYYEPLEDEGAGDQDFIWRESLLNRVVDYVVASPVDSLDLWSPYGYSLRAGQTDSSDFWPPAVTADNNAYVVSRQGRLFKLSIDETENQQATVLWQYEFDAFGTRYPPAVDSEGTAFFCTTPGDTLIAVNSDGSYRWRMSLETSRQPVIAPGNTLLVVTGEGHLQAIGGEMSAMPPGAVPNFRHSSSQSSMSITLLWDPASGAAEYEIFRDGAPQPIAVLVAGIDCSDTSPYFNDFGLEPGTAYEYTIRAVNAAGAGEFSAPVLGITSLGDLGNLYASYEQYADTIVLSWEKSAGATQYVIYRDTDPESQNPLVTIGDVDSWTDTTVADWDEHVYTLVGQNGISECWPAMTVGKLMPGIGDSGPGDWRCFGGGGGQLRLSAASGPLIPEVLWEHIVDQNRFGDNTLPFGEPVFGSEDAVYLPQYRSGEHLLLALNPDGTLRFSALSDSPNPFVLDDGTLATAVNGKLVIYDSNGTERAVVEHSEPIWDVTLAPDGGITAITSHGLVSYSSVGTVEWSATFPVGAYYRSYPPTVGPDGVLYAVTRNLYVAPAQGSPGDEYIEHIIAFDPDGTHRWTIEDIHFHNSLLVDGTAVYVSADEALMSINPADGSLNWSYPVRGKAAIGPTGRIHVLAAEGLVVLNPDGSVAWSRESTPGYIGHFAPAIDSAGSVYFAETHPDDEVCLLNAVDSSGGLLWQYDPDAMWARSSPTIRDDGTLMWCLVRLYKPILVAVGPGV